jgi:hypothetical protein
VPVHASVTVDDVWQRFTGACWELVNAECTSRKDSRPAGRVVGRFERWCYPLRHTSS